MNDAAGKRPDLRASDAERDAAMSELGEHFQAGRLNSEEFGERLDAAGRARTRSDLDRLLADLPRPAPPQQRPAPPQSRRAAPAAAAVAMVIAALALIAVGGLFTGGHAHMMGLPFGHWHGTPWWLIMIPVLLLVRILRRLRRGPR